MGGGPFTPKDENERQTARKRSAWGLRPQHAHFLSDPTAREAATPGLFARRACDLIHYMPVSRRSFLGALTSACAATAAAASTRPPATVPLHGSFRAPAKNGWIFVHLQGTPQEIGFAHGYLLAPEIEDAKRAIELSSTHGLKQSWEQLRQLAQQVFWPKVPKEYREEIEGIGKGLHARSSDLDLMDLVAMNASMEFSYYYDAQKWAKKLLKTAKAEPAEHCSAFIANGTYTKDGRIVIGHNNWSDYLTGSRWNIIFDIAPASGHRILMDGVPGLIDSADDFGINSAGLLITETTIGHFHGFDVNGTPEFVRARKAMQYASSIDQFSRIMQKGNNGGYANTWLIGDLQRNELGRLELGLKNVTLTRTKDGYFVGSNFPINPKLIAEETDFTNDPAESSVARHRRWDALMTEYKGRIDVAVAKKFETDHYDVVEQKIDPDERSLCGHVDRSSRGVKGWQGPYGPAGAVEAKVADAEMVARMSFLAGSGHPCGVEFHAAEFLKEHPEYAWQAPLLRDITKHPWTKFSAARVKS